MKKILQLLFVILPVFATAQQYNIIRQEVCWTDTTGMDSSLTRMTYVSVAGGGPLSLFYVNAKGETVDVSSGGSFEMGYCGCCGGGGAGIDTSFVRNDSIFIVSGIDTIFSGAATWLKPELEAGNDVEIEGVGANFSIDSIGRIFLELSPLGDSIFTSANLGIRRDTIVAGNIGPGTETPLDTIIFLFGSYSEKTIDLGAFFPGTKITAMSYTGIATAGDSSGIAPIPVDVFITELTDPFSVIGGNVKQVSINSTIYDYFTQSENDTTKQSRFVVKSPNSFSHQISNISSGTVNFEVNKDVILAEMYGAGKGSGNETAFAMFDNSGNFVRVDIDSIYGSGELNTFFVNTPADTLSLTTSYTTYDLWQSKDTSGVVELSTTGDSLLLPIGIYEIAYNLEFTFYNSSTSEYIQPAIRSGSGVLSKSIRTYYNVWGNEIPQQLSVVFRHVVTADNTPISLVLAGDDGAAGGISALIRKGQLFVEKIQ